MVRALNIIDIVVIAVLIIIAAVVIYLLRPLVIAVAIIELLTLSTDGILKEKGAVKISHYS